MDLGSNHGIVKYLSISRSAMYMQAMHISLFTGHGSSNEGMGGHGGATGGMAVNFFSSFLIFIHELEHFARGGEVCTNPKFHILYFADLL